MITKDYLITAAEGMHARPATNLIQYHGVATACIFPWQVSQFVHIKKGNARYIKRVLRVNIRHYSVHINSGLPG